MYQQSNQKFKIINKIEEGKVLYDINRYASNSSERTRLPINNERDDSIHFNDARYTWESGTDEKLPTGKSQQKINTESNNIKSESTSTRELDSSFLMRQNI